DRELAGHGPDDRFPGADRLTQVAAHGEAHPAEVLDDDGVVEPVLLADLLGPRRIGVGPRHHARGIAGDQAHAGEDDEADDDQRDDRDDDPPDQKVEHGLTGPLSLPDRPPRRVQLRGGARGPLARRTPCTLSVRTRAPYLRRWALLGSFQTGRREGSSCEAAPRGPHARRTPCTLSVRTRAP